MNAIIRFIDWQTKATDNYMDWALNHGPIGFLTIFIIMMMLILTPIFIMVTLSEWLANGRRATFILYCDEWIITKSHVEKRMVFNVALKMSQSQNVTIVDEYRRKGS